MDKKKDFIIGALVIVGLLFICTMVAYVLYLGVKTSSDKLDYERGTTLCNKLQLTFVDSKMTWTTPKYLCSDNKWYTSEQYCKTEFKDSCVEFDSRIIIVGD